MKLIFIVLHFKFSNFQSVIKKLYLCNKSYDDLCILIIDNIKLKKKIEAW